MKIWIGFNKKWLHALNPLGTYQPVEIQNIFLPCGKDQTESRTQTSPISTSRSFPATRQMGEEAVESIPTLGRAMSWCLGLSSHNATSWAHQWQHRQRISHLFLTSFLKHFIVTTTSSDNTTWYKSDLFTPAAARDYPSPWHGRMQSVPPSFTPALSDFLQIFTFAHGI